MGWKTRHYIVPAPTRAGFQWKVSTLRGLQRLRNLKGNPPATVVVPAFYTFMPAEAIALGWLNEIDALSAIRNRIVAASRITGWDVFSFHTRHNLDAFYSSAIAALRETWLREGSLKPACVAETEKRYGPAYAYHCVQARLLENLVFQSCAVDWVSTHAADTPLGFHAVGTALISTLVSTGALTFDIAVKALAKIGARWDESIHGLAEDEAKRTGVPRTAETLGWLGFDCVRRIMEGSGVLALGISPGDIPAADAPARPFWFSATAESEPVLIQTGREARSAMEALTLASWAPALPKPIPDAEGGTPVRGWLVSPLHPMASTCKWSVHNYLLANPVTVSLFLDHIAPLGRRSVPIVETTRVHKGLPLSRTNVTGP